jgi:hypothetical protein
MDVDSRKEHIARHLTVDKQLSIEEMYDLCVECFPDIVMQVNDLDTSFSLYAFDGIISDAKS